MAEKTVKDHNGIELRHRARELRGASADEALAELERRRDNLHGAVIPAWERAERGHDPADWDLAR
jgi:hypothetical protein